MADRADGAKKKGNGKSVPRVETFVDRVGLQTKKASIVEQEIYPVTFKKGQNHDRTFYPKALQELLLGTGWQSIHERSIFATVNSYPTLNEDFFFSEFNMTYSRSNRRYKLNGVRIYPGRIEMLSCRSAHRCAVLDVLNENPYRIKTPYRHTGARSTGLELIVESACACFNEEGIDHEGSIYLYKWR